MILKKQLLTVLITLISFPVFSQSRLVNAAISQLGLSKSKVRTSLIATKSFPDNPNKVVIVVPEVSQKSSGYLLLSGHILIMNSKTKIVESIFFERDCWVSDELKIKKIKINTDYKLRDDVKVFGIEVLSEGKPGVHKESTRTNALFIQQGESIRRILNTYEISSKRGKLKPNCLGNISEKENTLEVSNKTSKGFFNLILRKKAVNNVYSLDVNGKCVPLKTESSRTKTFKYYGQDYQ